MAYSTDTYVTPGQFFASSIGRRRNRWRGDSHRVTAGGYEPPLPWLRFELICWLADMTGVCKHWTCLRLPYNLTVSVFFVSVAQHQTLIVCAPQSCWPSLRTRIIKANRGRCTTCMKLQESRTLLDYTVLWCQSSNVAIGVSLTQVLPPFPRCI
jgi:hypothetical protein